MAHYLCAVPPSANPRRRRELEAKRRQQQLEAQHAAYRRAVRKRRMIGIGVIVAVVLGTVAGVILASSDNANQAATSTTAPTTTTTTVNTGNNLPPASLPVASPGAALTGDTPCPNPDGSSARTTSFAKPPPMCIDPAGDYNATIHTTKGDIKVSLLASASPNSVNNFITLARYHYYDGLPVTRITPRGWAEIDGLPGLGYSIPSETLEQGSIATPLILAALPDQTGGSAGGLIIGIADQVSGMPPNATQIGNILDSRIDTTKDPQNQSTVQREIDKAATKSGAPSEVITITGITIDDLTKASTTPGTPAT